MVLVPVCASDPFEIVVYRLALMLEVDPLKLIGYGLALRSTLRLPRSLCL